MKILSFTLFQGAAKVPGDDRVRSSWSAPEFEFEWTGPHMHVCKHGHDGLLLFSMNSGYAAAQHSGPSAALAKPTHDATVSMMGPLPRTAPATAVKPGKAKPGK